MAAEASVDGCRPYYSDAISLGGGELRVYRCDWGWCVKSGSRTGRSRYLDEAFEEVLGGPLSGDAVRALLELLDRELTAERDRTGRTAGRDVALPRGAPTPAGERA